MKSPRQSLPIIVLLAYALTMQGMLACGIAVMHQSGQGNPFGVLCMPSRLEPALPFAPDDPPGIHDDGCCTVACGGGSALLGCVPAVVMVDFGRAESLLEHFEAIPMLRQPQAFAARAPPTAA